MSTQAHKPQVSRRAFIRAAGIGIAAAGVTATTATLAHEDGTEHWDIETDVIVVGSGGAACAAAVGAVDAGAKVLIVEKAPVIGGTTAKSGGGYWIPNSHLMRAIGIEDSREDFLRYCARVSYPELYNDLSPTFGLFPLHYKQLEVFYDNASAIIEKLEQEGALKSAVTLSWEGEPAADYLAQLEENKMILGRQLNPVDADGRNARGPGLVKQLSDYAVARGAEIQTEYRVTKILREDGGRVIGVEVDSWEGPKRIHAAKGVIFGSGGFTQNPEMRANFLRTPIMGGCAVPSNTGDLVNMASEIGVKLGNMHEAWNQQVILDEVLKFSSVASGVFFLGGDSMIMVNRYGKRTIDEKAVYPERSRSHQAYDAFKGDYPNLYQVMIFDEKAREFGGQVMHPPGSELPGHIIAADTLQDLAIKIDEKFASFAERIGTYKLDADFVSTLKSTIETFNGYSETGVDLEFHRGEAPVERHFHQIKVDRGLKNPYIAPISAEGPYYAVILAAGALDTKGGPVFNEHGQAMDVHDQPIDGLYVAGNCSASPSGKSYLGGGGTLGLGITFGYLAGQHAGAQTA